MDYQLEVSGRPVEVSTTAPQDDADVWRFVVNGRPSSVFCRQGPHGQLLLTVDGAQVEAFVARMEQGTTQVCIAGRLFIVRDMARSKRPRHARASTLPGEVTPPMPSVVVGLLVEAGDSVEAGQGLVVVSAMKMEVTLKAPVTGVVRKVNTEMNAKVVPGEILVEIEESGGTEG